MPNTDLEKILEAIGDEALKNPDNKYALIQCGLIIEFDEDEEIIGWRFGE